MPFALGGDEVWGWMATGSTSEVEPSSGWVNEYKGYLNGWKRNARLRQADESLVKVLTVLYDLAFFEYSSQIVNCFEETLVFVLLH